MIWIASCEPGVQHLRAVRLLRRTVRFAGGDQLDRPLQLPRDAADAAQALLRRHAVRHQLHAVEVEGHGLAGRARRARFGNFSNGGNSGFLINSFDPELNYGISDFDVRHQININGAGRTAVRPRASAGAATSAAFVNHLIGDWSVAGLMRLTSGFPFNVANCRSCWATNWNLPGNAMLVDPNRLPETETTKNAVDNRPSPFADAQDALTYFRRALPGEAGVRNLLRGDGYFTIDTSLSKSWSLGHLRSPAALPVGRVQRHQHAEVRRRRSCGDADVGGFGRYNGTLATCDAQAGRCMQFALRYEF